MRSASRGSRRWPRELGGKDRALAGHALGGEPAPHELAEFFGDGEPEPCATVFRGGGRRRLREGLEDALERLGVQPDPLILDAKTNRVLTRLDAQRHDAVIGELGGVREQVEQDLCQPQPIHDELASILRAIDDERVSVRARERLDGRAKILAQRGE